MAKSRSRCSAWRAARRARRLVTSSKKSLMGRLPRPGGEETDGRMVGGGRPDNSIRPLEKRGFGARWGSEAVAMMCRRHWRDPIMNVVCNNPVLYVVDYPALDAVEVIDKRSGKGAMMSNGAARRFRQELQSLAGSEGEEDFVELLDHYGALLIQPAVYH